MKSKSFDYKKLLFRSIGLILFLVLWEIAPRLGWVKRLYLQPFSEDFMALVHLILNGKLFPHLFMSLERIALGLLLATIIGVGLGLLVGYFQRINQALDLLFQIFRQVSAFALFPVFILFFGFSEVSKFGIMLWASLWPVLLNTSSGVHDVDAVLIRSVKSMGGSKLYIFFRVILPATLPQIFTGIRLSGSYCVMAVVVAEMIGAKRGLGYLVFNSRESFLYPDMYAGIITLAIVGVTLNFILVAIEKRFTSWRVA
ncbi:MAG: ABC transporter permease [Clostridiales Family XIII bacterium]|jgi:NitT/TauT family transport system permease protein|nr:ABC transporter permease [Clostridiales Family XIII bacterium]